MKNFYLTADTVVCWECFGERFYGFRRADTINIEEAIVGIQRGISISSIDQLAATEDDDLL